MRLLVGKRGASGQMALELAVLMPVVIAVALIVFNLARFVSLCAAFDRISLSSVTALGVSPAGTQDTLAAVGAVEEGVAQAFERHEECTIEVSAEPAGLGLTRFRCLLIYRPWPSSFVIAGVPYGAPFALRHERSLVVDRFKPGVVM